MDDELDLVHYVEVALRYGWLALVCVALALGVATLRAARMPVSFRATVLVATTGEVTQVSFDTAIATLADTDKTRDGRVQRLTSYVHMVSSPAVAEAVIAELGDALPAGYREPSALAALVSGSLASKSDLIQIAVTGPERELVRQVAEAWGPAYVNEINRLYGGLGGESLAAVQEERQLAEQTLAEREAAYQQAVRESPLERDQAVLWQMESAAQGLVSAQAHYLAGLTDELARVTAWQRQAQGLADHLQAAGGEQALATAQPALTSLKVQVYGALPWPQAEIRPDVSAAQTGTNPSAPAPSLGAVAPSPLSLSLQVDAGTTPITGTSAAEVRADVAALIAHLEARRASLAGEIDALVQGLAEGALAAGADQGSTGWVSNARLAELEQSAAALRAQIVAESQRRGLLLAQRNLAQESLGTLRRKEAELTIAARTTGAQVRLAAPEPSVHRVTREASKDYALAAVAGLAISVVLAVGVEVRRSLRGRGRPTSAA